MVDTHDLRFMMLLARTLSLGDSLFAASARTATPSVSLQ